jgi:hypothetical protein
MKRFENCAVPVFAPPILEEKMLGMENMKI